MSNLFEQGQLLRLNSFRVKFNRIYLFKNNDEIYQKELHCRDQQYLIID